MKNKFYLLDTNVVVNLFRGNQQTLDKLNEIEQLNISSIVYGELSYGVENATNKEKHIKQLISFSKSCSIIPVTKSTSKIYGIIKTQLKTKGKPIPENDIWIAAHTIEHNAVLLSDDKHFKLIEGLLTEQII
ncbi:MAG: type II toxin-antitoxin system VapC family toxin [Bacteroidales bacterium]|nr:type II toxin-antitoxin system VapC family toxin [Bacteroidales bacterium]